MAFDDDPSVPPLTVRTAAARLGLSVWGVHRAIERGELPPVARGPLQVSAGDVEHMRQRKQDEAIARIGAERLVKVASDVRAQLHPPVTAPGPRGHAALEQLSERVTAALGMPLLHGAALPDDAGCRWCGAEVASKILGTTVRPEMLSSEVGLALLGAPRCEKHRGLLRGRMGELAARVHPGGRTAVVAAPTPSVPAARRPRPAEPIRDDDGGRVLVARRLRETRAKLKDARRRGDQRAVLQKDAARVDGRPRRAAGPAGTKACGVAVGVRCRCHPNDHFAAKGQQ